MREREEVREVAGDEGLAEGLAIYRAGDEEFESVGEASEDLAKVRDEEVAADGGGAIFFQGTPEAIAGKVTEREFRVVLIVVFPDQQEAGGEAIAEFLAPWDAVGSGQAFVDEIQGGEQEQRLVRSLMALTPDAGDTDVQGVDAFDGGIEKHGVRREFSGFRFKFSGREVWNIEH